jgi:hypothetical protein
MMVIITSTEAMVIEDQDLIEEDLLDKIITEVIMLPCMLFSYKAF